MAAVDVAVLAVAALVGAVLLVRRLTKSDKFTLKQTVPVKASFDGMTYRVHPGHADPAAAANMLAQTNKRLIALMGHLKAKYRDPLVRAVHPERAAAVEALLVRYSPDNLIENSPLDPDGDSAYVVEKGLTLALCLRERSPELKKCLRGGCKGVDPRTMRLHTPDTTLFVAIHELAHISIDDVDHPPRFWSAFKFLLIEAHAMGLLQNDNFARDPIVYCGLSVDYNPYYDPRVPPIN